MKRLRDFTVVGLVLGAVACASASQGGSTPGRRQSDVITAEEIAGSSATNAYDLVRQLRPQWLTRRGVSSTSGAGGIQVYLDGVRHGGLESLQALGIEQIREVRFLDASNATTRFGTGHPSGAIEVLSRR